MRAGSTSPTILHGPWSTGYLPARRPVVRNGGEDSGGPVSNTVLCRTIAATRFTPRFVSALQDRNRQLLDSMVCYFNFVRKNFPIEEISSSEYIEAHFVTGLVGILDLRVEKTVLKRTHAEANLGPIGVV